MRPDAPRGRLLAPIGAALLSIVCATGAPCAQQIALEEEAIPAAELSATPSPTVTPGPNGETPEPSPTPEPTYTVPPTPNVFPEPTPMPTATGDDESQGEIGTVAPAAQVSDLPLDSEIAAAQSDPARAASVRVVEQARQELQIGKQDEAIRTLQRAMSIDSSDPYAYFYLGRTNLAAKQFEQAMAFFKRAETGFGSNPAWLGETLAYEGLTYELSDHLVAAEAAYQQALQASPGNLMAHVGYTRVSANIEPTESPTPEEAPSGVAVPYPPQEPPAPYASPGPTPSSD